MNYEFTGETKTVYGITLHRIRATKDNPRLGVMSGDVGGWIEQESNLSEDAWVSGGARVYGNARVFGDALVYDRAQVSGDALVYDRAQVSGDALVYDRATVYGGARVYGNATVTGEACVYGGACVSGRACVFGEARVYGGARVSCDAHVSGNAHVYGDATIKSKSDYSVFHNTWSSGRWFTYTRSNRMWKVGCFYGTGDELIKKAYADSEKSGKCYETIVRAQEAIEKAVN